MSRSKSWWERELEGQAATDYWRLVMARRKKRGSELPAEHWLTMMEDLLERRIPPYLFATMYLADGRPKTGNDELTDLLGEAWNDVESFWEFKEFEAQMVNRICEILPRYKRKMRDN